MPTPRAQHALTVVRLEAEVAGLKELLAAQREADASALRLQAKEYERRLDDLNHAHENALDAQSKTVSRELFDAYREKQAQWETTVNRALAANASATRTWSLAIAGFVGVLEFVLRFWKP